MDEAFFKKNMLCEQNIQIVMMILKDAGMNAGNQSSDETKQQFKLAYVYIYTCLQTFNIPTIQNIYVDFHTEMNAAKLKTMYMLILYRLSFWDLELNMNKA